MSQRIDASEVTRMVASMRGGDERLRAAVHTVMKTGAVDVQRDAKLLVPVDIGNLRASITRSTRATRRAVEFEVGPTAAYGLFVEEGTSTQAPQPYLQPALMRNLETITSALQQAAKDALR